MTPTHRNPIDDAQARWRAGREAHGNGPWVGQPPLAEAYEEALDLMNYLREWAGNDEARPKLWYQALSMACAIADLLDGSK